jgi:hypothetical protein
MNRTSQTRETLLENWYKSATSHLATPPYKDRQCFITVYLVSVRYNTVESITYSDKTANLFVNGSACVLCKRTSSSTAVPWLCRRVVRGVTTRKTTFRQNIGILTIYHRLPHGIEKTHDNLNQNSISMCCLSNIKQKNMCHDVLCETVVLKRNVSL